MRNGIGLNKQNAINNQRINTLINLQDTSNDLIKKNPVFEILNDEGCENFVNYVEWLGFAKDPNIIFLSSLRHYYYDAEDLKNVNTIINLKKLNEIVQIKSFLHSIFHILPQKSNFIGCFVDNKKINAYDIRNNSSSFQNEKRFNDIENSIVSRIPFLNMLYSVMDSKTNNYMSRRSVTLLLEDNGFKVLDMTELKGLTYFHTKKFGDTDI